VIDHYSLLQLFQTTMEQAGEITSSWAA
jgi:hypothetical protein